MRILKQLSGWTIYNEGTASEAPRNLVIINPMNPKEPIIFGEWPGGHMNFCDLSFKTLSPKEGLIGCSDLLIIDWNNGKGYLWIISYKNLLKFHATLYKSDEYEIKEVNDGLRCVLFINGERISP